MNRLLKYSGYRFFEHDSPMKKLTQALLLALVVAAPIAISAPQAQAKMVTPHNQVTKTSSKQQVAANTADAKTMTRTKKRRYRRRRAG